MDSKNLALFQHLATSLHFGRTAQALYVSPSTLSRAIQRLEEELQAPLFVRDNRSVSLTAVGQKLLSFSNQYLQDWQSLKADIQSFSEALRGELSLFCSVTASFSHLPPLLDSFRQRHPLVDIKLITGDPSMAINMVSQRQVDIAIAINTPDLATDLAFQAVDRIPLLMIAPTSFSISRWSDLDWRKHAMILPDGGPSKRIVHHWLTEHGIRPRVYASVAGNEAIVSMVALGCGIAIVPQVVLANSVVANKITSLKIPDIEPYELGLCCVAKRRSEPVIQAFLQHEGEG